MAQDDKAGITDDQFRLLMEKLAAIEELLRQLCVMQQQTWQLGH